MSDIFKPGDGCILRVYEGDNLCESMETFKYVHNLIGLGETIKPKDHIPFSYKPTKATMMTEGVADAISYIVKVEGVLI